MDVLVYRKPAGEFTSQLKPVGRSRSGGLVGASIVAVSQELLTCVVMVLGLSAIMHEALLLSSKYG